MHWIKVTAPRYEQSQRYEGKVGEVIGTWGPENSSDGGTGFMVQFDDGEVVSISEEEMERVDEPAAT